jgi:hypothetical protein
VHQRQVVKDDTSLFFDNPVPTVRNPRDSHGRWARAAYFIPTVLVPAMLWQAWEDDVEGQSLDAGHFFPEEAPGANHRRAETLPSARMMRLHNLDLRWQPGRIRVARHHGETTLARSRCTPCRSPFPVPPMTRMRFITCCETGCRRRRSIVDAEFETVQPAVPNDRSSSTDTGSRQIADPFAGWQS